jgi:hypothetical protein
VSGEMGWGFRVVVVGDGCMDRTEKRRFGRTMGWARQMELCIMAVMGNGKHRLYDSFNERYDNTPGTTKNWTERAET